MTKAIRDATYRSSSSSSLQYLAGLWCRAQRPTDIGLEQVSVELWREKAGAPLQEAAGKKLNVKIEEVDEPGAIF